jgi:predicted nucleotidyltransferase
METKLTELVGRLKAAGGDNLKSVILYGSAVTGEFVSKYSDVNILCVVGRAGSSEIEEMHGSAVWWIRQGHPAPLVFTLQELERSADIFAVELLDIKHRHRLLFGEDFFANFEIPLRHHRLQVERELRTHWLRLRQAILAAPLSNRVHLALMTDSVSAFCALFRHALFAAGQQMPDTKRAAVAAVASVTGADPSAFNQILDLREGKRKPGDIDVEVTLHNYLVLVEVVTAEVDRIFDAP